MKRELTMMRSAGLSLIELMISVLLGILLILGAGAAYLAAARSYTEVEQVSSLAENAEFAEQILSEAIMHAGFFGEVSAEKIEEDSTLIGVVDNCANQAAAYDLTNYIFAAAVDGAGAALGCIDDAMEDTEVLVVKRVLPRPFIDSPVGGPGNPGNGTIDSPTALQAGTSYIMTNNVLGILFDGSATAPTIIPGGAVPDGKAWAYLYEAYYVRDDDPNSEDDTPWLARKVLSWNGAAMAVITEDVVEGVERMNILLGVDTDADGEVDSYTDGATVTANDDWANIASVEVFLLVRSATKDFNFTDTKSYSLGGANLFTPPVGDAQRYRRLLVHTSASLRNPKLTIRGPAE